MKWPPDRRSIRVFGPLLFLVAVFVMILVSDAGAGDTGSAVTVALIGLILFFAAQRFSRVVVVPGRSVGGGAFFKSISLRPEEFVAEELGEASTWPKRLDKLVVTNQRLMTVPGRSYLPFFGSKGLLLEISEITCVTLKPTKWYTAWFDRSRIHISTDTTHYELWPAQGEDAAVLQAKIRETLAKHGWRQREQAR